MDAEGRDLTPGGDDVDALEREAADLSFSAVEEDQLGCLADALQRRGAEDRSGELLGSFALGGVDEVEVDGHYAPAHEAHIGVGEVAAPPIDERGLGVHAVGPAGDLRRLPIERDRRAALIREDRGEVGEMPAVATWMQRARRIGTQWTFSMGLVEKVSLNIQICDRRNIF